MKEFSEEHRQRMSESAKKRCTPEWRKKMSERYSTKLDLDRVKSLYENGYSQTEIASELGVTQRVIWRFMKNNNIPARVAFKRDQKGDKNDSWNGGKSEKKGYILILKPEHQRALSNGYVYEHILVAEKMIGRSLKYYSLGHGDNEIVHHINQIKNDNRPENLQVMTAREHTRLHNNLRKKVVMPHA